MSRAGGIGASASRRTLVAGLREAARVAPSLSRGLVLTAALALVGAVGALVVPVALQSLLDAQVLASAGPDVVAAGRLAQ